MNKSLFSKDLDSQETKSTSKLSPKAESLIFGSVMSGKEIKRRIETEDIKVKPFHQDSIGPGSMDLRLGYEFRAYTSEPEIIDLKEETDYKNYTYRVDLKTPDDYFELPPHTACLGVTLEEINLSPSICAFVSGRSRFARLGLFVHFASNYVSPGVNNRTVLELFNASSKTLRLYPEVKICQLIFMNVENADVGYSGAFNKQEL